MQTVNIHEAKTHLSRLLTRVARGETVMIAKAGIPMAKMVPLEEPIANRPSRIGFMKGLAKIPDDFDTMYAEEIERMFYGDE